MHREIKNEGVYYTSQKLGVEIFVKSVYQCITTGHRIPRILATHVDMDQKGEQQQRHGDLAVQTDAEGHDGHEDDEESAAKESVQKPEVQRHYAGNILHTRKYKNRNKKNENRDRILQCK